jgi:hypothetical protein
MGYAVNIDTQLAFETIECCNCGVIFAVLDDFKRNLHKTKQSFYCPNGHSQSYTESTAEKLRKELAAKEQALAWEKERTASLNKQLTKERKASARLKRRVSVGVCPCCQRTVSQLARHMQTQHPEFVKQAAG